MRNLDRDQRTEIRDQVRLKLGGNPGDRRVVGGWYGLVSWWVMRLSARFSPCIVAAFALAMVAGASAKAQTSSPNSGSSSSSSVASQTSTPAAVNGSYISIDPLALVRYDNRFDMSLTMAYQHIKAGPNVLQGANLGGLDLSGSYWLTKRWGVEGSARGFLGTSGVGAPSQTIKGPFISEYFFTAGPEWLGPHNKHGDLIAHVLVGGVYGNFEQDLRGQGAEAVAFYNNQLAPAIIMGGHWDLNRSAHWVFRVTTDAAMTHYGTNYGAKIAQWDINTNVSVGVVYKFTSIKR